jgi:hypothetical protein
MNKLMSDELAKATMGQCEENIFDESVETEGVPFDKKIC